MKKNEKMFISLSFSWHHQLSEKLRLWTCWRDSEGFE